MLRRWRLELLIAAMLAATGAAYVLWPGPLELIWGLLAFAFAGALAVRMGRKLLRPALWKLQNRLLAAYLFIAVIPILLILLLARNTVREIGGQIAVHLVSSELDRRVAALLGAARTIVRTPAERRDVVVSRIEELYRAQVPDLRITQEEGLARGSQETSGVVVRDGYLFAWAQAQYEDRRVTFLVPISRKWLAELVPGLGDVSIIHFPGGGRERLQLRSHGAKGSEEDEPAATPPAANRFDTELLWGSEIPLSVWGASSPDQGLLGVHSRLSAVMRVLLAAKTESKVMGLIYFYVGIFLVVQAASIYIGISLTRTITGAVSALYEGTVRVMRGEYSHRIGVRGNDQIAELSRSFNQMTENVERSLKIVQENERIQAELQIARQVQSQLFPRVVPELKCLELKAVCNPARSVSGDYYDYQRVGSDRMALVLGDVAGKGISAALLMASLQASLRMQLSNPALTPAQLVTCLNQYLHANTAPEKFATFFFGMFDDDHATLTYTNAGHLQPLLLRGDEVIRLDVNGMVVGAFPFAKYDESQVKLEPGDLLIGYTDGITEPENEYGEMFGEERLIAAVRGAQSKDLESIAAVTLEAVQQFTGSPELQDDMTLILARRR
jgi:sigma-B regulation protein RsbU (phosphoserine phosphatase)